MGGVLTVETGLSCNNSCGYCPLRLLRPAHGGLEPPTGELLRRIAVARDEGFDP
ncbi:MAG: hypothetical protein FJ087_22070, partial [Deltaproteobacteria bacterium]|nr:hypothetical protein [Deltaproteobacteria bacterium]